MFCLVELFATFVCHGTDGPDGSDSVAITGSFSPSLNHPLALMSVLYRIFPQPMEVCKVPSPCKISSLHFVDSDSLKCIAQL